MMVEVMKNLVERTRIQLALQWKPSAQAVVFPAQLDQEDLLDCLENLVHLEQLESLEIQAHLQIKHVLCKNSETRHHVDLVPKVHLESKAGLAFLVTLDRLVHMEKRELMVKMERLENLDLKDRLDLKEDLEHPEIKARHPKGILAKDLQETQDQLGQLEHREFLDYLVEMDLQDRKEKEVGQDILENQENPVILDLRDRQELLDHLENPALVSVKMWILLFWSARMLTNQDCQNKPKRNTLRTIRNTPRNSQNFLILFI